MRSLASRTPCFSSASPLKAWIAIGTSLSDLLADLGRRNDDFLHLIWNIAGWLLRARGCTAQHARDGERQCRARSAKCHTTA